MALGVIQLPVPVLLVIFVHTHIFSPIFPVVRPHPRFLAVLERSLVSSRGACESSLAVEQVVMQLSDIRVLAVLPPN